VAWLEPPGSFADPYAVDVVQWLQVDDHCNAVVTFGTDNQSPPVVRMVVPTTVELVSSEADSFSYLIRSKTMLDAKFPSDGVAEAHFGDPDWASHLVAREP
jgi:hypothetical protein